MGRLRSLLRNLKREAREEMIEIPQTDGTVKRFPQPAVMDAFRNLMDRMGAGDDAPPEHPMVEAIRNAASDATEPWHATFQPDVDPTEWVRPVQDLSEP